MIVRRIYLALHAEEYVGYLLRLVLGKMEDGMVAGKEEERRQFVDALYGVLEEVVIDEYADGLAVWREGIVIRHAALADDNDVTGTYGMRHRIDEIAGMALHAHGEEKALHAARVFADKHACDVVKEENVVADVAAFIQAHSVGDVYVAIFYIIIHRFAVLVSVS